MPRTRADEERLETAARDKYPTMTNRAMARKLTSGEAIDVSGCPLVEHDAFPGTAKVYDLGPRASSIYQDDVDYCDAGEEAWIWSIGHDPATDHIYASRDSRFYQDERFTCLWLR